MAYASKFLDSAVPLAKGSHAKAAGYAVTGGRLVVLMADGSTTVLADPLSCRLCSGDLHASCFV